MQLSPLLLERIEAAHQAGLTEGTKILSERIAAAEQVGEQRGEQRGQQIGALEGRQAIVLRQLTRVVGLVPEDLVVRVKSLSLGQVEDLADALLGFGQVDDLLAWLRAND
jgi:predicted transposase YdaD